MKYFISCCFFVLFLADCHAKFMQATLRMALYATRCVGNDCHSVAPFYRPYTFELKRMQGPGGKIYWEGSVQLEKEVALSNSKVSAHINLVRNTKKDFVVDIQLASYNGKETRVQQLRLNTESIEQLNSLRLTSNPLPYEYEKAKGSAKAQFFAVLSISP